MYFFAISKHFAPMFFSQLAHNKKVWYHEETEMILLPRTGTGKKYEVPLCIVLIITFTP